MLRSLFSLVFAAVMWVQVPQWKADWSKCAVDVPDVSCHWYIVAPDNTFGEGFDWATAPWFDANGLQDVAQLENTMLWPRANYPSSRVAFDALVLNKSIVR